MRKSLGLRLLHLLLTTLAGCIIMIGVFVIGPAIETTWFPVYSKFKIISLERYSDTQSLVVFKFTKNRQCEPQGASWFFGEPGAAFRQLRITVQNPSNPSMPRPLGTQTTFPYIIDATVEEVANATFAEIYNRCHPFWLTRSEIYP